MPTRLLCHKMIDILFNYHLVVVNKTLCEGKIADETKRVHCGCGAHWPFPGGAHPPGGAKGGVSQISLVC